VTDTDTRDTHTNTYTWPIQPRCSWSTRSNPAS